MVDDRIGFHFHFPLSTGQLPEPPLPPTIEAVALLLKYSHIGPSEQAYPQRQLLWFTGLSIMVETLSSRMMSWRSRSSSVEQTENLEVRTMQNDRNRETRENLREEELRELLKNPKLAEEAFPDKEVREKIIPLFQHFRKIGDSASSEPQK